MSSKSPRGVALRGADAAKASGLLAEAAIGRFENVVITPQNQAEAMAAARKEAAEQGYADGFAAARADVEAAMEDSNKRVRRALAALCDAVDSFDQRQAIALTDVEDAIMAGAVAIARSILQHEVAVSADPGADALARAMTMVPNRANVVARLNPDDFATLSMDSISTSTRSVDVVSDPGVEAGGCVVEIGETSVDAQLGSAIAKVSEQLIGAVRAHEFALDTKLQSIAAPGASGTRKAIASAAAGSSAKKSRTTASEAPVE